MEFEENSIEFQRISFADVQNPSILSSTFCGTISKQPRLHKGILKRILRNLYNSFPFLCAMGIDVKHVSYENREVWKTSIGNIIFVKICIFDSLPKTDQS